MLLSLISQIYAPLLHFGGCLSSSAFAISNLLSIVDTVGTFPCWLKIVSLFRPRRKHARGECGDRPGSGTLGGHRRREDYHIDRMFGVTHIPAVLSFHGATLIVRTIVGPYETPLLSYIGIFEFSSASFNFSSSRGSDRKVHSRYNNIPSCFVS